MDPWIPPLKPFEYVEQSLLSAILDGTYPPGSTLPGERDLASRLGVTRPTLREVLGKLACDGWLTIQHGKPTRVNDYWIEGGLKVLNTLTRYGKELPPDFITNLLEVRLALAPAYTRLAITHNADRVSSLLVEADNLSDEPAEFAAFDWRLHHQLTILSGNPVFTLILNGFVGFYEQIACIYFSNPSARQASRLFYTYLHQLAQQQDYGAAEELSRRVMQQSIDLWRTVNTIIK